MIRPEGETVNAFLIRNQLSQHCSALADIFSALHLILFHDSRVN